MKKFGTIFFIFLFLSFNIFIVPCMAAPTVIREGFHSMSDLNLAPNTVHTIQNTSPNEYAFAILFDSNQSAVQFIRLNPQSEKYILAPIQVGYEIVIVGNAEIAIT